MERGHRALREAHQRQRLVAEAARGERRVDEAVDERRHCPEAGEEGCGRAVLQAEPLPAERPHVAGKGRIGRQELRLGQQRRQIGREPDKIAAVGADAVQQDDQLARLAAGGGLVGGTAEALRHGASLLCGRAIDDGGAAVTC
jgi:hypothetical protein